jgi:hypothetical protein
MTSEKIASIALTAASGLRLTLLLCSAIRTTLRESAAEVNLAPHPGCVHFRATRFLVISGLLGEAIAALSK